MLEYAALITPSPLLLTQPDKLMEKALSQVTKEIEKRSIEHILLLRGESSVEREGLLTAFVHPKLTTSFKDLGNLSNEQEVSMWWDAYYRLQKRLSPPLEPLDNESLAYQHGLVLHALFSQVSPDHFQILATELSKSPSKEEAKVLARLLNDDLDPSVPYALIIPASFAFSQKDPAALAAKNAQMREEIMHMEPVLAYKDAPGMQGPDFLGAYETLLGAVGREFLYQELCWVQSPSAFLVGQYVRK